MTVVAFGNFEINQIEIYIINENNLKMNCNMHIDLVRNSPFPSRCKTKRK